MSLKDVGEILRNERERRGLSVEDVTRKTKISRRNLEALEMGDAGHLPHEVYVRGFVKTYAHLLGMPPSDLRRMLDEYYGTPEEETEAHRPQVPKETGETITSTPTGGARGRRTLPWLLILVVAIGALVWGGISYLDNNAQLRRFMKPSVVKSESAPAAPEEMVPEAAPEAAPDAVDSAASEEAASMEQAEPGELAEPAASAESVGGAAAVEQAAPAEEAPPAEAEEQPAPAAAQPAPEEAQEASAPSPAPEVYNHVLRIQASSDCWVGATLDEDVTKDFILREGRVVNLRFNDSMVIKFGNAGAVSLTYDGTAFPFEAPPSQVLTLHFP